MDPSPKSRMTLPEVISILEHSGEIDLGATVWPALASLYSDRGKKE